MASSMRALVKPGPGPGFLLTDVPVPSIGPTDVLIKVEKAGVCGTDHHIYSWDSWAQQRIKPPIVVGHEFMGTVAEVGSAVRSVRVGERVSAEGHIADLTCLLCRTGEAHICEQVEIIGVDRDGAFAEYIAMPEYNVWRLDPAIPDEVAAIFDPLGNAVHTVMAAGVSVKSVAITGVGSIGLMAIPVARAAGATAIYAIDVNPAKLELAARLGADATLPGDPARFGRRHQDAAPAATASTCCSRCREAAQRSTPGCSWCATERGSPCWEFRRAT